MPIQFVEKFGDLIPSQVTFHLEDGQHVKGFFDRELKQFSGLQQVFRLTCFKPLEIVLFTYYGDGKFDVSVFGGDCVEKPVINDSSLQGTK